MGSFMGCGESFITTKLHWHGYLVLNLGNCVYEIYIETDLSVDSWPEKYCRLVVEYPNKQTGCRVNRALLAYRL